MNRKLFSVLILAFALLAVGSTAMAQTGVGDLRGHVYLKQADGTKVPVEGAVIDIYRTDVGGRTQVKTKKDGSYVHAGLQYVATYLLSISAPGANPKTQSDVKAGRGVEYDIVLDPGNGRVLTEAEAKASGASAPATGGGGGKETPEEKAAREKAEAANAKIAADNAKTTRSNEVVTASFTAGNELLTAGITFDRDKHFAEAVGKYSEAIAKYDEGINIDPEHPGAPSLLTNRTLALTKRAIDNFNLSTTNAAEKTALRAKVSADLVLATEGSDRAITLLKAVEASGEAGPNFAANKIAALTARAQAYKYLVSLADQSKADQGVAAFEEYMAAEVDAAKKSAGRMDLAKMLFDAYEYEKAIAQYQKILTESPDNLEATYWLGLALMNDAAVDSNNKVKYQNAVNQLQAFADKAPATDARKVEVQGIVDELKRSQNVTPVKPTNTRRRGN